MHKIAQAQESRRVYGMDDIVRQIQFAQFRHRIKRVIVQCLNRAVPQI